MGIHAGQPFAKDDVADLTELIEAGKVAPVIDRRYSLDEVPEALRYQMEGRPIDTIGYRGMQSYEVALEDWWVPAANQVGMEDGLGKGFYYQMAGFENGRLQTAARAVGVMQAAYEEAVDYAENRKVFGQSISSFQGVQWMLADMAKEEAAKAEKLQAAAAPADQ